MILLTGGAGYIGSHTLVELARAGYETVIFDNFSNASLHVLPRLEKITGQPISFVVGDLLVEEDLENLFSAYPQIEAVIHFAGKKAVGESVESPLMYYENNVQGTISLLRAMQRHDIRKLVFSSSATVYGDPEEVPISESASLQPTNPYGRTKLMIEQILLDLKASWPDMSLAILRYFNPIGAHKSGLIGEDPAGIPNNLLPFVTQVAIGKRDKLSVFGSDYPTLDGTGIRDYIHVMDLARGHVAALEKMGQEPQQGIYNLGTGRGYSVLEVVASFASVSGIKIPYQLVDRRPGDIARCYADPAKAKRELSWEAQYGLDDMCRDAWHWQKNNPQGYEEG